MDADSRFREVFPGVLGTSAYSPAHKVDLATHAVRARDGWVVVDPACDPSRWTGPAPVAVILTNGNHERACAAWAARWQVPVIVPAGSGLAIAGTREAIAGSAWFGGWHAEALDGGGPGETAYRIPGLDLVVFGDAVVNLPGRGLEVLPDKYCSDPARLRASLRRLVAVPFGRAVFAHGDALASGASARIAGLL